MLLLGGHARRLPDSRHVKKALSQIYSEMKKPCLRSGLATVLGWKRKTAIKQGQRLIKKPTNFDNFPDPPISSSGAGSSG